MFMETPVSDTAGINQTRDQFQVGVRGGGCVESAMKELSLMSDAAQDSQPAALDCVPSCVAGKASAVGPMQAPPMAQVADAPCGISSQQSIVCIISGGQWAIALPHAAMCAAIACIGNSTNNKQATRRRIAEDMAQS
jgi:hypothetical protein